MDEQGLSNSDVVLSFGKQANWKRVIVAVAFGLTFGIFGGISYHRKHSEYGFVESTLLFSVLTIPGMLLFSLIPTRSDIVITLFKDRLTLKRRYRRPISIEFSDIAEVRYECGLDEYESFLRVHFRDLHRKHLHIAFRFRESQINKLLQHFHGAGIDVYTHKFTR